MPTDSTKRQSRQATQAKIFTKQVFTWLRQIKNDHELPPSAALCALQLTEHLNRRHGGAAWASCEHVANAIGMSKATVVTLCADISRSNGASRDVGTRTSIG